MQEDRAPDGFNVSRYSGLEEEDEIISSIRRTSVQEILDCDLASCVTPTVLVVEEIWLTSVGKVQCWRYSKYVHDAGKWWSIGSSNVLKLPPLENVDAYIEKVAATHDLSWIKSE